MSKTSKAPGPDQEKLASPIGPLLWLLLPLLALLIYGIVHSGS